MRATTSASTRNAAPKSSASGSSVWWAAPNSSRTACGTTIPTNPISPLTLTTAAVPRVAVSTSTSRTRAGSTPRLAASTSPTAITSRVRRYIRIDAARHDDVRQRDPDVRPAVGAEPAEHPGVDREQRVVVPLLDEVLDRVEERADRDPGQHDHHGSAASPDGAAEGVRRGDAQQPADEREQRDARPARLPRRPRCRGWRPGPRRWRRRAGRGRRAGCGTRPGTPCPRPPASRRRARRAPRAGGGSPRRSPAG